MAYIYYSFSFTIKNDSTYDERRASFLEAIRSHGPTFEQTTSYVLVRTSDASYNDLQTSIYASEYNIIRDKFICSRVDLNKTWTSGPDTNVEFTYK